MMSMTHNRASDNFDTSKTMSERDLTFSSIDWQIGHPAATADDYQATVATE
jgi:hypothetical protein